MDYKIHDQVNKDKINSLIKSDADTSIIIIGDTPDDLEVLNNLTYGGVLKMGFNVKEKGLISDKNFDMILDKNESLYPIIDIIKQIVGDDCD